MARKTQNHEIIKVLVIFINVSFALLLKETLKNKTLNN